MSNVSLIASLYHLLDVEPMTRQQEMFAVYFHQMNNVRAAARMVGCPYDQAEEWLADNESMGTIIQYLAHQEAEDFEVTRGLLNNMLMEAWYSSEDATEKTGVVRELAKINGQYPGAEKQARNTVINNTQFNVTRGPDGQSQTTLEHKQLKQIHTLSDDELAQMAGNQFAHALTHDRRDEGDEELVYDAGLDIHVPVEKTGNY